MQTLNETHDPNLRACVPAANAPESDFPIQNLPFGVFGLRDGAPPRGGVAIGDHVLDVAACARAGLLGGLAAEAALACDAPALNRLLALGPAAWSALRLALSRLLREGGRLGATEPDLRARLLFPLAAAELGLPLAVGDYTDFYASVFHATNVGAMMRPDNPLLPNYKYVPIGYHGRASSLVPSGAPVRRPRGQLPTRAGEPSFGPSARLDYELELAFVVGLGNPLGEPVPIERAGDRLFGVALLNDWSARDMQRWEYQPLGPFLAKSFATTLAPWLVTFEALAPFRCPAFARPAGDPTPLPYLSDPADQQGGGLDLTLEVGLLSQQMRAATMPPAQLSRSNAALLYWTPAQLLAHHTSNGCNLRPADVLGSGTVSGPEPGSRGCLLELTWRGTQVARATRRRRRVTRRRSVAAARQAGQRPGAQVSARRRRSRHVGLLRARRRARRLWRRARQSAPAAAVGRLDAD